MSLMLNWTPTADHAPLYYAKSKGWYSEAGIDLNIEAGKGSAVSAQRVGTGGSELGISDLPTTIQARGKGADVKALMVIYANIRRASTGSSPRASRGRRTSRAARSAIRRAMRRA